MRNFLALFLLLAAAPGAAAREHAFRVVSERTIAPAEFLPAGAPASLTVPLTVLAESGSQWAAPAALEKALGKAAAVFARCGVALGAARALEVAWSPGALESLNLQDPYAGPSQLSVIDEPLIPARRPAVFLFGTSVPATAAAYSLSSVAQLAQIAPEARKLLNTVWITEDWHGRSWDPDFAGGDIAPSFSVLAHELAHLLGDLPHTPEAPNLMSEASGPGAKSGDLSPAQCAEVRRLCGLRTAP